MCYVHICGISSNIMFLLNSVNKFSSDLWWVFLLGFLIKTPIYPFHLWLPKAHVEAPVRGSIILAGVILKLGRYGLMRFFNFFRYSITCYAFRALVSIRLVGGLICRVVCITQVDLKCLVAYSSVRHISLVLLGLFRNLPLGYDGALYIMIGHGLCSSGLFRMVTSCYNSSGSRRILINKGYLMLRPILTLMIFLLLSRNIRAPPRLNLLGEIIVFMTSYSVS